MPIKLTLRISPQLIKRAKIYAKRHEKSVSQIVSDYFALLTYRTSSEESISALPITQSLRGVLEGVSFSEMDYKNHLAKKYL